MGRFAASTPRFEALDRRTMLSTIPGGPANPNLGITPSYVDMARRLVAECTPENNAYGTPTVITFKDVDGATVTSNFSVCSTLVTHLLKKAYGFTNSQFTQWTGETSPEAEDYYDAAMANDGFTRLTNIANLKIGDLFMAKYLEQTSTATGHTAIVAGVPTLLSTQQGERWYSLPIIDSSSSYHGTLDTRYRIDPTTGEYDEGIGQGTMRVITDTNGLLIKYSWSLLTSSIIYDATERPSCFARIPKVPRMLLKPATDRAGDDFTNGDGAPPTLRGNGEVLGGGAVFNDTRTIGDQPLEQLA